MDGIVEKPDVVGAIFGQTEGLLGEELDLRELQKSGRVGRIDVEMSKKNGKSFGKITVPSSLDRVETAILAAALETVDRVGPCEAKVKIINIEDTRSHKREQVIERAQEILKNMIQKTVPESKEISEKVRDSVKTAEVCEYGPEKLACGPDVFDSDEIIIVEGRADVINLLKADIKNAIAVQGKHIPDSVAELTKQKTAIAFVDGDRGGDLILKQMEESCEIDYVAKAPDGKEVEELTKKEILKCLRNKMPYNQYMDRVFHHSKEQRHYHRGREAHGLERQNRSFHKESKARNKTLPFSKELESLKGSLKALFIDREDKKVLETEVRNIADELEKREDIKAVVFDGIVTQRLVDIANKKNVDYLVAVKKTRIKNDGPVKVYTEA